MSSAAPVTTRRRRDRALPTRPAHSLLRVAAIGTIGAAAGLLAHSASAQAYTYHEFPSLSGYPSSGANGINNLGFAVGFVSDPVNYSHLAVIWDTTAPTNAPTSLGVPPHSWGLPSVSAIAINDLNEIIGIGKGVSLNPTHPLYTPYRWTSSTGFVHLQPLGGTWNTWSYTPRSINCAGNVVGSGVISSGYANGKAGMHWTPSTTTAGVHSPPGGLGMYSFVAVELFGGNDHDQVVGAFGYSSQSPPWFQEEGHAFFWDSSSGYANLSAAAFNGEARDVNNCEQVIGAVRYAANGPPQTVLWERQPNGDFWSYPLPGLSPDPTMHTYPRAINDSNQAIGRAKVGATEFAPVVWDLATLSVLDLRPFLPTPNPAYHLTSYEVFDINDSGIIVGKRSEQSSPTGPTISTAFVLVPQQPSIAQCQSPACVPSTSTFDLWPPLPVGFTAAHHTIRFTVTGGTPGETVRIVDDSLGRYRQSIASQCPFSLPPNSMVVATAVVDSTGTAVVDRRFPASMGGVTVEYVAIEANTCVLDVESFTHP